MVDILINKCESDTYVCRQSTFLAMSGSSSSSELEREQEQVEVPAELTNQQLQQLVLSLQKEREQVFILTFVFIRLSQLTEQVPEPCMQEPEVSTGSEEVNGGEQAGVRGLPPLCRQLDIGPGGNT